jgi:hypothetical protein
MEKFWKKQNVRNYLVQDLFDVDEIVRSFGSCPDDEDYKIIRSYYYIEFIGGEEPYEVNPTNKEDYIKYKDSIYSEFDYRTELNYEDFLEKFWIDSFEDILYNHSEPDEQNDFINCVIETYYELSFEGQAKLFLGNVINGLNELSENLNYLLSTKDKLYGYKINWIQERVIKFYIASYIETKNKIINHFKLIYPEIENEFKSKEIEINTKLTREELLKMLIGDNKNITLFEKNEKKLISYNYLTDDYEWNKKAANLARFYLYCINKNIIKSHFKEDYKKGLLHIRNLYSFYDSPNINANHKILLQLNKKNKAEFDFLHII